MANATIGPNDPENQEERLLQAANRIIKELELDQPHQINNLKSLIGALQRQLDQLRQGEGH